MTRKNRQLLEKKLEKLHEARILATGASEQFKLDRQIEELEQQLIAARENRPVFDKHPTTTIENSKNVVNNSELQAGGNIHIGDVVTNVNPSEQKEPPTPPNWKIWLGVLVGTVTFLAAVAEFTGYNLRDFMATKNTETTAETNKGYIKGTVRELESGAFLAGAEIRVGTDTILYTDGKGIFKAHLPNELQKEEYQLTIIKAGYESKDQNYSPFSTDADVRLKRKD